MDAMVTARMSVGKKEAGGAVLHELGLTASQVINELYDYLIAHRDVPFKTAVEEAGRSERLAQALAEVDEVPKMTLDSRYAAMDIRDARAERLARGGFSDGAA